ncbi:pilus assembly protein TadG-related protein [Streptomyces sp. H27-H1]|uniref:pilus assembly protein TadG-related protein n=1 Tax=Streptomyces sp. H27-H1 TaxID=2996461 RepID=UPI00226FF218|nr:pilus assembly protein TadG-related protein [Streptomyces sp. H27-H1]MCY0925895.1 pilus assembly protein TadG-related protein [Streptomyces sp. H27-H1]
MIAAGSRDRGQVFPFYIAMVACLLFAALAFVVVGMAGATRSDAQGAADAAALAAARETRDHVLVGRDLLTLTPEQWGEILRGIRFDGGEPCAKAQAFAASNEATAECDFDIPEFTVTVTTNGTVGESVIPGSETMQGHATATALIEPRCSLQPAATPSPTPPEGGDAVPVPVGIQCRDGSVITMDPSNPGSLSKLARKLFSVRLAD